jgi:hypothetical protein
MNDNIDLHSATLSPLPHRSARLSPACISVRPSPLVRLATARLARTRVARRPGSYLFSITDAPPILAPGRAALTRNPQ